MGGEHLYPKGSNVNAIGSSPHGRGTWLGRGSHLAVHRFIPAWAGNMNRPPPGSSARSVHPRMGGEHKLRQCAGLLPCGSSPHGRGTFVVGRRQAHIGRFIPAWAGNIGFARHQRLPEPVHPRMGGEHRSGTMNQSRSDGSSPHGRGTFAHELQSLFALRFIPAWAGNMLTVSSIHLNASVHPRMGGEHHPKSDDWVVPIGSSPHGRGT